MSDLVGHDDNLRKDKSQVRVLSAGLRIAALDDLCAANLRRVADTGHGTRARTQARPFAGLRAFRVRSDKRAFARETSARLALRQEIA